MSLNPPPAESATQPPAPGGFAALARRIGGWTGNLLATAIVLVASLAIGRQILHWWREDAPAGAGTSASADAELPFEAPKELRLWTSRGPLCIERVRGDRLAALTAMRRLCSNLTIPPPPAGAAGPGERRYVETLAKARPVEQTKELDLYEPAGEPTMVVAVARSQQRIAAWSFALPGEQSVWTCYTFYPAGGTATSPAAGASR